MKNYFVNLDDGRLRAGWRILVFMVTLMGLSSVILVILRSVLGGLMPGPGFLRDFFAIGIAAMVATTVVPLARRVLDKKSFNALGLKFDTQAIKDLVFGFLLSGLMAASIFFIMKTGGLIEVTDITWGRGAPEESQATSIASYLAIVSFGSLTFFFLTDLIIGWWEELVFRGYLLQNMIEGMGLKMAVGLSCLLYGLIHVTNPNAGLLSTGIIVLFGFLRIYGYLSTKLLWLSIGMHIGWNFFQGPIFGYAASGHETPSLIAQTPIGPDWLSGGAFGPEGSIITIPIIGLALLVMRWRAKKTSTTYRT